MITRKMYNEALDIVDDYHKQERALYKKTLTTIIDWEGFGKCSTRLWNVLRMYDWNSENTRMTTGLSHIETINKSEFLKRRHAGITSWNEFKNLRGY